MDPNAAADPNAAVDYSQYNNYYGYYQNYQQPAAGAADGTTQYQYPPEYYQYYQQQYAAAAATPNAYAGYGQQAQVDHTAYGGNAHDGRAKVPQRRDEGQPSMTLWVGNIPPDCSEEELRMVFSPHGYIEGIKVLVHVITTTLTTN